MNLKIVIIACLIGGCIWGCFPARQLSSVSPVRLALTEEYLWEPQLAPTETKIADLYAPPRVEITDTFTADEKWKIAIPDEKLFTQRANIILDVSQITDTEFVFPLSKATVKSPYGKRRGRQHTGIDLATVPCDTIRAAFSGIIRIANKASGYGNVVVIRHYNGLETLYAHNSKHFVKSGDRVEAGTPIALSGRTGRATGDHLHFETRINGQHFNPALLIDFKTYTLKPQYIVFLKGKKGEILVDPIYKEIY